ncbi:hypothetical protein Pfo_021449 [Paulownia fortunei]|nr:hypothetical protein Pfo_021449 [Paulownia fortunei]
MDRYQKVEKPKVETPIDENEIRITSQGRMRSYITYAMSLLQEKGSDDIVFKAMGRAINKTVTIVELIKRRIVGLHQITAIQSTDITDTWEPLEEGLQTLETTRKVSMVTITLSKKELEKTNIGLNLGPANRANGVLGEPGKMGGFIYWVGWRKGLRVCLAAGVNLPGSELGKEGRRNTNRNCFWSYGKLTALLKIKEKV